MKKKINNFNLLDNLKNIEDKADLSPWEPFKLIFYDNLSCLSKSKDTKQHYKQIIKEYDNYFEFHNMMLLEHKINILADIILDLNKEEDCH